MRFPNDGEDLTGKVCICSNGRLAVVTGPGELVIDGDRPDAGKSLPGWEGMGFDGKGTWFSTQPVITAESVAEFRARCSERFQGRLCYHDI